MKRILFAAPECLPLNKDHGTAGLCGALPGYFNSDEWDIRICFPGYTCIPQQIREQFSYLLHFYMQDPQSKKESYVGVLKGKVNGITCYLIDNQDFFDTYPSDTDSHKELKRSVFFSKAVFSMLPLLDFHPDLIHCFRWQCGLLPVYLKTEFQKDSFYRKISTVFTFEDLLSPAIYEISAVQSCSGLPLSLFTQDKLEFHQNCSLLKAGLVYADYITCFSPGYSNQIQTDDFGRGFHGLLGARHLDMQGIMPGISSDFSPADDPYITEDFDFFTRRRKKSVNKTLLQKELGIPVNENTYMIGILLNSLPENGLDLILSAMEGILDDYTQVVAIGCVNDYFEKRLRDLAWRYSDSFSLLLFQDERLYHQILASCDAMLFTSMLESDPFRVMQAQKYGCIPVVRESGCYKDLVEPFNIYQDSGNGFSFLNNKAEDMLHVINYSKQIYYDRKAAWEAMADRNMQSEHTWSGTAGNYEDLYNYLINR